MPAIIGPIKGAAAPTPATPAATPAAPTAVSNAPRQQAYNPPPPGNDRDDEGVRREEGDSTTARAGGYPRFDSFGPLPGGNHTLVCSVNKIVRWPFGTILTWRVELGDERGRQIDWGQSPPDKMSSAGQKVWRETFFGAYAHGGWPLDPDPETNWPGWSKNSAGVGVPPYDQIFVHTAPDGVQVPVLCEVTFRVDPGYEKFVKTTHVRHYLAPGSSMPVQAPMPFQLPPWLARQHGWVGAPDSIVTKLGTVEVVKVDYKQVPFNHGGLQTLRDIMKGGR